MAEQPIQWDREAEERVRKAPFFVRPFIKRRLEREAAARGTYRVTLALVDQLKSSEHRGD